MKNWLPIGLAFLTSCAIVDDAVTTSQEIAVADANQAIASGAGGSEVWLATLHRGATWSITNLRDISTRPGYDNQPAFVANGSGVYYSSIRDDAQADIYLYEPLVGARHRQTATPQSEFSPLPLPLGSGISIVRVETDGKQSLWSYAGNRPLALLTNVDNLGYYTWLDVETVAMVLVDEPPRLAIATVPNGAIAEIPVQPGRSLQRVPAIGTLSFVDKSNDDTWWISDYDRHSGKIRRIAPALADSEDFAWTPEGELLMASGRLLYIWRDEWELIADLSDRVSGAITRIAVGPNGRQIAFVTLEGGL